jgi:hypothetical protein
MDSVSSFLKDCGAHRQVVADLKTDFDTHVNNQNQGSRDNVTWGISIFAVLFGGLSLLLQFYRH